MTSTNTEQIKMYYGQDGKRGLHMVAVVLKDLDASISAQQLEMKMEPFINVSASHWLGWRVSGLAHTLVVASIFK